MTNNSTTCLIGEIVETNRKQPPLMLYEMFAYYFMDDNTIDQNDSPICIEQEVKHTTNNGTQLRGCAEVCLMRALNMFHGRTIGKGLTRCNEHAMI